MNIQQHAWEDLASRMSEKGCSAPKLLSEDRKREIVLECLELLEKGDLHTGTATFGELIEAEGKPKLRGWYKRSKMDTLEEGLALDKARKRPVRIEIRSLHKNGFFLKNRDASRTLGTR